MFFNCTRSRAIKSHKVGDIVITRSHDEIFTRHAYNIPNCKNTGLYLDTFKLVCLELVRYNYIVGHATAPFESLFEATL